MTTTFIKTDETYARTRKAVALADVLSGAGARDAREVSEESWAIASKAIARPGASSTTRAAVTALLDVEGERFNLRPQGDGAACKTYYATRKAARIAGVFWEVGLDDAREATAMQWRNARMIAGVDAPSDFTRTVVEAILDHRREAFA